MELLSFFTFLILLLNQGATPQRCDNSICNYEAICILKDNHPTCDCVKNFYEGEFCSKRMDHCSSNPCQNGGTCFPYLGHFYCECSAGFGGQRCTSKQDTFKGLHLHFNRLAPVTVDVSMLITLQTLGTVHTLMDFFTPNYLIDGVAFTSESEHFKTSNDLKKVCLDLHLRHCDDLPYKQGFYRKVTASFWNKGIHKMGLDSSDEATAENFFTEHFDILVFDPSEAICLPIIHLPDCSNPRKPLHVDIMTFDFVEPIVDKRCSEFSHIRIKWSVRNYVDSVVLHTFPEVDSNILTIPPFTMWFNYRDDYVQSYLIQGDVIEEDHKGYKISNTILRCYTFVDSKPTTAHIIGGPNREINIAKGFVLDGSLSRDYARDPKRDQQLEYNWSCASEDAENSYCLENMGKGPQLTIPPKALKLGQVYKYSLHIRSTINIYSTHVTSQQVKAVSEDPLFISFQCLRNCKLDKFAAEKLIHLRLNCIECPEGQISYSVLNDQGVIVAASQSVIFTEKSKKIVLLTASASLGTRTGSTSIELTLNNPPAGGKCKISPTSGIAYTTVFEISCPGYEDEEKPIDYIYKAGSITIGHSGNDTLSTRLFPTSGQICEILISICDDIEACVEVQLQASLSPISPDGPWLEFLSQNETNLSELVKNGDRSAVIVLIKNVISNMQASESFDVAKHIVECLNDLELGRLHAVEQILTVANDLLEAVELNSDSALLVSHIFSKVSNGLLKAIASEEVVEMIPETHEQMIGELTQSMARTATQVEEFPMNHDAESIPPEDPFSEDYPDYGELVMEDVVHMTNWLNSFNRMHRCLQVMGVVSAFIHLPGEASRTTKSKGITTWSLVVDKSSSDSHTWKESATSVSLPNEFVMALPGNEIAIQVSIFESNPLWWCPEQYKLNNEVLSVGAYTKDSISLKSRLMKKMFSFFIPLRDDSENEEQNVIKGRLENSLDMLIYERLLPPHAVLVVKFLSIENNIRVLQTMSEKPRSYMFENAQTSSTVTGKTTMFIENQSSGDSMAYIAIRSATKTTYSFSMFTQMCLTWNSAKYEWTSQYCSVGGQTNDTHIHCSCWHLSLFGAKVHPTFAYLQDSSVILESLHINYLMIMIYGLIIVLLSVFTCVTYLRRKHPAEGLVVLNGKPEGRGTNKYLVTIYTNGHTFASTSSNVTIQLHGSNSDSLQYTLYSQPYRNLFLRNAQTSFEIVTDSFLGNLHSISLHHDSFGRYPSWNCRAVKVTDESTKDDYVFLVNKWLSDLESTSCSISVPLTKENDLRQRRQIFFDIITDGFANWYARQTICSAKLFCDLTLLEKATIFTLRVCITIIGIIVVFGPTTMYTYEEERETYYFMLLPLSKVLFIAFWCHIVGAFAGSALQHMFLRLR